MANWRLNRNWFWILVAVYFAIKLPVGHYAIFGSSRNLVESLDTPLVIALALVVGARLNDAGRNRWIGIGGTLLITMILPLVLLFGDLAVFGKPPGATGSKQEFLDLFSAMGLVSLALLAALLIWAGTRPPATQLTASYVRREPTM